MEVIRKVTSLLIIFLLATSVLTSAVVAQDQPVAPELYSDIQQRAFLESALASTDPATLTQEALQRMMADAAAAGFVPQAGFVTRIAGRNNAYVFTTGLSGTARGVIPAGEYHIEMPEISDVSVVLPKTFLTGPTTGNELAVGMRTSKSANLQISKYTNRLGRWIKGVVNAIVSRLPFGKKPVQPSEIVDTAAVTVRLFQDDNGNGMMDRGEKPVPWANVRIIVTKVSKETALSLVSGTNSVRFDAIPINMATAYDILAELVAEGSAEATITDEQTGESSHVESGKPYGTDVPIRVNHSYTLTVSTPVTLTQIFR